jgi:hypothetical protein
VPGKRLENPLVFKRLHVFTVSLRPALFKLLPAPPHRAAIRKRI